MIHGYRENIFPRVIILSVDVVHFVGTRRIEAGSIRIQKPQTIVQNVRNLSAKLVLNPISHKE